jgi:putative oxidoreductase
VIALRNKINTGIRIVFGILLLGASLPALFGMDDTMEYPEPAHNFMMALEDSGYTLFIVTFLKVLVGLSLVVNRFVPLALVVFMPVSVNMVLFHVFLDIGSILPALVIGVLNVYLMFIHIESYKPLLQAKKTTDTKAS